MCWQWKQSVKKFLKKTKPCTGIPITLPGTVESLLDKKQYVFMLPSGIISYIG
jgi:hypothetical protein